MATTKKTAAAKKTAAPSTSSDSSTSSAAVGDVVSYQLDENGPTATGVVVGRIDSDDDRDAQLLVAPLPDATAVPLDAVKG